MRVGGPADLFAVVHNAFELRALIKFARTRAIPYTILGRGSRRRHRGRGDPGAGHPGPSGGVAVDGDRLPRRGGRRDGARRDRDPEGGAHRPRVRARDPRAPSAARCGRTPGHTTPRPRACSSRRPSCSGTARSASCPPTSSGSRYRHSRFKDAPPALAGGPSEVVLSAVFRLAPADPTEIKAQARRDPPLAPGAPAAGDPVGGLGVPQPRRRLGGAAHRRARAQGHQDRRLGGLREARELHRQRPARHRGRRPPPRRARPPRRSASDTASSCSSRSSSSGTGPAGSRRPPDARRRRSPTSPPPRRSRSSSAGRRPSTTCPSCPGPRSPRPCWTPATRVERGSSTSTGGWWRLPDGHRRDGRPQARLRRPGRARGRRPDPAGEALASLAADDAPARRLPRAPRPVRRGRHGPGAVRGGRPRVHGLGRDGERARAWTRRCSSGSSAGWACRSSTGARSARRAGRATPTACSPSSRRSRRRPATRG